MPHRLFGGIVNLMILIVVVGVSPAAAEDASEDGFRPIFDGETLDGWKAPRMEYFSVEDGAITARGTEGQPVTENQFLVWQGGEVDDFELKMQFRIGGSDAANSGVQFRSEVEENDHVKGYQADIDRSGQFIGALYDELGRGMLAERGQKVVIGENGEKETEQIGDADELFENVDRDGWNDYHIIARGNHITLKINGETTAEVIDRQKEEREMAGVLALQLHSGPPMTVQFRDIRLKRLPLSEDRKKVVFVAGRESHGYMAHEHRAGSILLADALNENMPNILATVYTGGWPSDPTAFDNADTIVMYCDGGGGHMANPNLEQVNRLAEEGVGIVCLHYAVETVKGEEGEAFLDWIGGYFEPHWSVNPHWVGEFDELPDHPITRGVEPFSVRDEWYYHMRFREGMEGVTPILTDLPPDDSLSRPDGAHSGNPHVREAIANGEEQHVAWASERPGGGRGFGFTGGHFHWNWAHDDLRKTVLNAIAWTAHADVPEGGVPSERPTVEDLEANQDFDKPDNWDSDAFRERIEEMNQ